MFSILFIYEVTKFIQYLIHFNKYNPVSRYLFTGVNNKYIELPFLFFYFLVQGNFLQTVSLSHQSFDPVSVNCPFKIFITNTHTKL